MCLCPGSAGARRARAGPTRWRERVWLGEGALRSQPAEAGSPDRAPAGSREEQGTRARCDPAAPWAGGALPPCSARPGGAGTPGCHRPLPPARPKTPGPALAALEGKGGARVCPVPATPCEPSRRELEMNCSSSGANSSCRSGLQSGG